MCHTICLKHAILPLIALTLHVTACGLFRDENPNNTSNNPNNDPNNDPNNVPNNNIDEVPCGGLCPFEVCVFDVCLDDEDALTSLSNSTLTAHHPTGSWRR